MNSSKGIECNNCHTQMTFILRKISGNYEIVIRKNGEIDYLGFKKDFDPMIQEYCPKCGALIDWNKDTVDYFALDELFVEDVQLE